MYHLCIPILIFLEIVVFPYLEFIFVFVLHSLKVMFDNKLEF